MSKILLLGDTFIGEFPKQLLEKHKVINAGAKNIGVRKYHKKFIPKILKKVQDVDYVVLQIGLTNILNPLCDKDNLTGISELIKKIQMLILDIQKIKAPLVILSLSPTNNNALNQVICEFNERLEKECFEAEIDFINIYNLLIDTDLRQNKNGHQYLVAEQIKDYINILQNIKTK